MIKKIRNINLIIASISIIISMWYTVICMILEPTVEIINLRFTEILLLIALSSALTGLILWLWELVWEV
jgi:hypothetical protein